MPLLLPSLQAERIRRSLVDYLSTTFALTDAEPRRALADFLEDEQQGVFVGPFVRLRLPYLPASNDCDALDWDPGLTPYRHQAQAYQRLTTKNGQTPEPTIVTTGTGSGKTEAFLHPIIDHVLRARATGQAGIKALILYPMNALAADQAGRLAQLITSDPALAGIRAALYTGDTPAQGSAHVSPGSLITDRHIIRDNPPDILLTNYKMLDQLLLRPEDRKLWQASAASLTYLVLDEFHTYDGAQGTDVAILLRRLGLALRAHLAEDNPRQETYERSPLGPVCPVATSATLGDGDDPSRMLAFAQDVFGTTLPKEAVIQETRTTLDQWAAPIQKAADKLGLKVQEPRLGALPSAVLNALAEIIGKECQDPVSLLDQVVSCLYQLPDDLHDNLTTPDLATALQAHPAVLALVGAAQRPTSISDLAQTLLGPAHEPVVARKALSAVLAALSAVRAGLGSGPDRGAVNVEVTLWVREITRLDRALSTLPTFRWADSPDNHTDDEPTRPALYCRSCGRSGWGVVLATTGQAEKSGQENVRRDRLVGDPRFRALLSAPGEGTEYRRLLAEGRTDLETLYPGLRWYDLNDRELLTHLPHDADLDTREGRYLPVLTLTGEDKEVAEGSTNDVCPSCGAKDSIRFLGSAVATLLSVSLTTLFGDQYLDSTDKRALVFTDSVQDAAHRAGYVDQRSHTMSLRSALRGALSAAMPIDAWADATLEAAHPDAFDRYRLVPSALTDHPRFKPYWDPEARGRATSTAKAHVRRRLLFDVALEVGLQSAYGRTLEATGALTVHVEAGRSNVLTQLARNALGGAQQYTLPGFDNLGDSDLLVWVRGTLEHMRRDGGIDHEWLARYKEDDGKRLWIWYKRKRKQGQPAFPPGRSAPAFPEVGGSPDRRRSAFVPVTSSRSWYATWTRKCLRVTPTHAARLASNLLAQLATAGVLSATPTNSGGTVYGIPAQRVIVSPLHRANNDELLLVCDTCHTQLPAATATVDQLDGVPCLAATCPGTLQAQQHPADSFYRDLYSGAHVRRVDAHEHTSLLGPEERAKVEEGFKRPKQRPGDPNVLVATPTLEMGIDIGDLSTVVLASLPDTVASYVQRAGRAGRRSGSSLVLAYVPGRKDQIPLLNDPQRMLAGAVAPPSTYLEAEEILRRQFLASVIDSLSREGHPAVPTAGKRRPTAQTALSAKGEGSLISTICERLSRDGELLVKTFTSTFSKPTPALEHLTEWVVHEKGAGPRQMLERAVAEHRAETEHLRHQENQIRDALPKLLAATNLPNATEEDKRALKAAQGAKKAVEARLLSLQGEHWVSALERHGVLPNYALIDDTVRLSARVSWRDPETDKLHSEPHDINRLSSLALHEFSPGATFYTHGMEMRVDGIDSSDLVNQAEWWFTCEFCGYVATRPPQETMPPAPTECPRCHSNSIAEVGRARRVLHLTRVFADVSKDDARIGDSSDERVRTRFEVTPLADFDPGCAKLQWSTQDSGFGLTRYRGLTLRWLNTGKSLAGQAVDRVAGKAVSSRDFKVCEACGKLASGPEGSTEREHRPWCEHRTDPARHTIALDLMRSLRTEALALVLPQGFDTDQIGMVSLSAAIMLGLEIVTGGAPDHLGVIALPHPVTGGSPGETRPALLVHDTVPGGTGYLTDLALPNNLWSLLVRVGQRLEDCPCREQDKAMCHLCLQPHAVSSQTTRPAALHAIRQVLGADKDTTLKDLDPEVPTWHVLDEPVRAGSGESPLEVRFRAELAARLDQEVAVRTIADSSGAPALEIDGGKWRVRPQLDAAGSRPDFTCLRHGHTTIAVFVDGHAFHSTHEHNRLADDAQKRARLRAQGYHVISLSAQDLNRPWQPMWLNAEAVTMLKNGSLGPARAGAVTDQAVESWAGGPMALLQEMLLDDSGPTGLQAAARSALADSIWGPLVLAAARGLPLGSTGAVKYTAADASKDPLWEALHALHPDKDLPPATSVANQTTAAAFTAPHLALVVQTHGALTTGMTLVLDDTPQALEADDHAQAWVTWLRLSNVLPLAQAPVTVTTTSLALEELQERSSHGTTSVSRQSLTTMQELGWDQVDQELTPTKVLALLPHLASAGVAHEDDGAEVADGVMTDLSWQGPKVAFLAEDAEDDVAALEAAGWRVVVAGDDPAQDTVKITTLLKGH